jgi:aquaporin Z
MINSADPAGAARSLRRHWPEYLMEGGETACYLFAACALAVFLWHPGSPVHAYLSSDPLRRLLMGTGMATMVILIVYSPWGKQSGAHFNPAVTFTFCRLGRVALWDAFFYCSAQLVGALVGVAAATVVLRGTPAHSAVRYSATLPGMSGNVAAFFAEAGVSFLLMMTILISTNQRILAPYTRYFAAALIGTGIAFESPLSGMSANPARSFGPAVWGSYYQSLWIYFTAPTLGMLAAAEGFLAARQGRGPFCAKLDHQNDKRCIFCESTRRTCEARASKTPGEEDHANTER